MPSIYGVSEDVFITQLEVNIDNNIIKTGYGVGLKSTTNNLLDYKNLLEKCSFDIVNNELGNNGEFYIRAKKEI